MGYFSNNCLNAVILFIYISAGIRPNRWVCAYFNLVYTMRQLPRYVCWKPAPQLVIGTLSKSQRREETETNLKILDMTKCVETKASNYLAGSPTVWHVISSEYLSENAYMSISAWNVSFLQFTVAVSIGISVKYLDVCVTKYFY